MYGVYFREKQWNWHQHSSASLPGRGQISCAPDSWHISWSSCCTWSTGRCPSSWGGCSGCGAECCSSTCFCSCTLSTWTSIVVASHWKPAQSIAVAAHSISKNNAVGTTKLCTELYDKLSDIRRTTQFVVEDHICRRSWMLTWYPIIRKVPSMSAIYVKKAQICSNKLKYRIYCS